MSQVEYNYVVYNEVMNNFTLTEQVAWRFVRAGLSSAFSTAATVTYFTGIQTWEQFGTAINALSLALIIGFVTGIVMAIDKYFTGSTVPIGLVE